MSDKQVSIVVKKADTTIKTLGI
jgi:hypothetical protein